MRKGCTVPMLPSVLMIGWLKPSVCPGPRGFAPSEKKPLAPRKLPK
jgi:hypothetical protein